MMMMMKVTPQPPLPSSLYPISHPIPSTRRPPNSHTTNNTRRPSSVIQRPRPRIPPSQRPGAFYVARIARPENHSYIPIGYLPRDRLTRNCAAISYLAGHVVGGETAGVGGARTVPGCGTGGVTVWRASYDAGLTVSEGLRVSGRFSGCWYADLFFLVDCLG